VRACVLRGCKHGCEHGCRHGCCMGVAWVLHGCCMGVSMGASMGENTHIWLLEANLRQYGRLYAIVH
jgi:hypothetical protein